MRACVCVCVRVCVCVCVCVCTLCALARLDLGHTHLLHSPLLIMG